MTHFGKLVKQVAHSRNLAAEELAELIESDTTTILKMYEDEEWRSGDIIRVSAALNYDFGPHLDRSHNIQFFQMEGGKKWHEVLMNIKYPKGQDEVLYSWINSILQMAKSMGLEVE